MTDRTATPYAKLVAELADCENALRQSRQTNANSETSLRLTADHLRLAFQNSPMPVFHQDQDLRYTWVYNPAFESGPSILGKTDEDLMPPAEAQTLIAAKRRVLQSGLPERIEIRQWIDGREWWFDVRLAVRRDANGYIEGLSGVAMDITDRKRAEEALRQSEERLALIARATNDALYDWDFQTGRAWSNDTFVKQFGKHPADVESDMREWLGRLHPDERDRVKQGMEAALNGDAATWTDEYHFRRADGSYAFLFDRAHIVRDAQGKAVRVVGAMLDLSERRQVEEALRASEEKFSRAFGLGPIVLCLTSLADGRVIDVNESLLKFTGHRRDEVIGRTPVELGWWASPEQREHGLAVMRREGQILNQEMVFRLKNGETRTCLVSGEIIDISGQRCVLTALVDITERKQAEERLHLLADLGERLRGSQDVEEMLFSVAQAVGKHLQVRRAFFVEIDLTHNRGKVHRDYRRGVPSVASEYAITDYSTITLEEVKAGRTVVNHDSQTDPRTAAIYDSTYQPNRERAYVAVPLMREGVWVSALWVSDDQPRQWTEEEVALLETVAQRAWLAVENVRLFKETKDALAERDQSLAAVRESRQMLALAMRGGRMGAWSRDLATNQVWWSRELEEIFGLGPNGFAGTEAGFYDFVHAEDKPLIAHAVEQAIAEHGDYRVEFRFHHADGSLGWMEGRGRAVYSSEGQPLRLYGIGIDITERKQAETALRESERRHRSTFENAAVGIAHFGLDGSFLHVNARQCEMLGYTREELLATTWQAISHPAEIALNLELRERHIRGETESYSLEKRYFHKHGPVVWVNLTASLRRDEQGEPLYFVTFIEDISARKRAEAALRASEAQFRYQAHLLETVQDAIVASDANFILTAWNGAAEKMYGWSAGEVLGRPGTALLQTDFSEGDADAMRRAIAEHGAYRGEVTQARKDGTRFPVEVMSMVLRDEAGRVTGYVSVNRDITARKQAEEAVRESETRYRQLVEMMPESVYIQSEGRIRFINPAGAAMLGYDDPAQLEGVSLTEQIMHPDFHDQYAGRRRQLEAGEAVPYAGSRWRRRDGQWIEVEVGATPMLYQGQPAALTIARDITARKRAEAALRESEERFRTLADSAPVLIWVNGPEGNEYVNRGCLEFLGVGDVDVRGYDWAQYIHSEDRDQYVNAYLAAVSGRTLFEAQFRFRRYDGEYRWMKSTGTPRFTTSGEFLGFVGSTFDIHESKLAEEQLRRSHDTFLNLIQNTPFGVYLVDSDFRLAQVSAGSQKVFSNVRPLLGRDFNEVLRIVWPEPFASEALARFRHTLATGEPYHSPDTTEQRGDIAVVESYDWEIKRVTLPDGKHGVVCYFYETTARVHAESDARLLADLAERIRLAGDADELLAGVVALVGRYLRLNRCYVSEIDEARDRWWVHDDYHAGLPSIVGEYRVSDFPAYIVTDSRAGRMLIAEDAQTDPRSADFYAAAYEPIGIRAHVVVPLTREGRWRASLVAATHMPRVWQTREIALLETVAERVQLAVEKLRLDAALRESEARFRNIAETGNDGIWQVDAQARTLYANEYMAELLGCSLAELQSRRMTDFCFEEDLPLAQARILANLNGQKEDFDFRFRRLDGTAVLVLAGTSPVRDAHGVVIGALGMFSDITERKRAERRTRFLAEATRTLTESLDMQRTLQEVARLAVPDVADWCTLNLLQPDGSIALAAAAHRDPEQEAMLWSLAQRYPLQVDAADGTPRVIRTGQPELHGNFHEELDERPTEPPLEWLNESQLHSLVIVPLSTRGHTFGALTLASIEPGRRFDHDDLALAEEIARRAALVMENAQLFRDEQEARQSAEQDQQRISSLQVVTAALSNAATPAEVIESVIRRSAVVLGIQAGNIKLISPDGQWIDRYALSYPDGTSVQHERLPIDAPTPGADVCRTGEAVWLASQAAFAARYPTFAQPDTADYGAAAIVPLQTKDGWLGALAFRYPGPQSFSEEDREFILALAGQCTQALERARLFEAERLSREGAERATERVKQLQNMTAALARVLSVEQVLEVAQRESIAALHAAGAGIHLLSDDGTALEMIHVAGYDQPETRHVQRLPLAAHTPTNTVFNTGQPLWFESPAALAEHYPELAALSEQLGVRATLQVPIQVEGHTYGVLALGFAEERAFQPEELGLLGALANQCAQALERARLYAETLAWTDTLEARVALRTDELRRSQEQLRRLSTHQDRIREAERTRIAREIHDELGGTLTGLKMMVARLRKRRNKGDLQQELGEFNTLIDTSIQTMRRVASDLRPAVLDSLGLLPALEWQAQEFQKRTGITCHLQVMLDELELDNDRSTAVFRVFQESLTNVARHAQATQVLATVAQDQDRLVLQIQDNGLGLGVEAMQAGRSLGLLGMRERIEGVLGQFEISSGPGSGTTVLIHVPLSENQPEAMT